MGNEPCLRLHRRTEAIFHDDSYGCRPRKGALDAVTVCRQRCWEKSWVIDLDIRKFFDSVPWDLAVKAVRANVTHEQRWITLYVRRWLAAPIVMPGGRTEARDRGTPQGGLCAAAHNPPYEQCWVMRSAGLPGLVGAGSASERCA